MFDKVNDFLVRLDADGRCLAGAQHTARQQQESPRYETAADHVDKTRKRYTTEHAKAQPGGWHVDKGAREMRLVWTKPC